jgi:hypothetical protein
MHAKALLQAHIRAGLLAALADLGVDFLQTVEQPPLTGLHALAVEFTVS